MKSHKYEIIDAHTHFFSYTWFNHFYSLVKNQIKSDEGIAALGRILGWEIPPKEPHELGKMWAEELDRHGVKRQVLFASKLNDAEYLAAAVQEFPNRLIGYVMIDPNQSDARDQIRYSLHILGMKGVTLFPAMHHFYASDEIVYPIYEEAASAEVPVFIHFGILKMPVFQKLGLPDNINLSFSNPLDLKKSAQDFPDVNFIIPHFGCGRFEQALEVAGEFNNVYFDTSSSNAWIEPPLDLKQVFKNSLEVLGPERLLFGTDSSYFPRGWRKEIFEQQDQILNRLQIPNQEKWLIFGGNIARLLFLD
ncbi:MAG: amidohydrolase family protein [bacterium]